DGPADDEKPLPTPATLPRLNPRSKITGYLHRPSLKTFGFNSTSKPGCSFRSPDRFLPRRRSDLDSVIQSFRANKEPKSLSTEEKLLRHKDVSPDAFNPRRRVSSPIPQANRPVSRRNYSGRRSGSGSVLAFQRDPAGPNGERQVSVGTVWRIGGLAPPSLGVSNGRGGLLGSGTNAPLYTTSFSAARPKAQEETENHENRLAHALELDRVSRVLEFRDFSTLPQMHLTLKERQTDMESKTSWTGTEWTMGTTEHILDAPNLRDDFYCSVLAYSATCHTLAVGLGPLLYAWSEMQGVHLLNGGTPSGAWLTSIAFSSTQGCKSILAFGRSDSSLTLMSLYDSMLPRFEVQQPCPIACVTWRPHTTMRPSRCPVASGSPVKTEDLLVGDEIGNVYYYSVEWPEAWEVARTAWSGSMTLLARIMVHTQQICGLSFSSEGSMFATGGNDNLCCLFQTNRVLHSTREEAQAAEEIFIQADGMRRVHTIVGSGGVKEVKPGSEKHRWGHGAAVKAIAFCPWRDGLVATGGGSNDKCIHFYHTSSGACLATISVAAQVTSLIWSTTRREIAATFGYAQPEHPYRIAVFSWPECKQVAAIPWDGEHRALYAIPYPGGPNESQTSREGGRGLSRTAQEGCIVVASSDESVKFHEVWTAGQKTTAGGEGLLGGSDILEGLEGIDKEGEVIR
ncbi:WD40 repeat-like protein, partial [Stipitochalara longipes BDJ]